ncbi:DUF6056 family protein [Blautia massiliensis (ex Durand et al. 2017)]|uniref:DUF6056 family protein n=1 Tax=Blautia massiliensis (ex Durand et al. 2017) TaxID=1737424 RepID=UPI002430AC10|nr:DUF6056 family protein [Blautia massiliensis (ex Durand et al. 2017)]MDD6547568.1 DUF6056 family protein [Blautia massiliensis (ex Durand et al. 2017)]
MKHDKAYKRHIGLGIAILLCIITIALLYPVIRASKYARPVNDDYSFSYLTHRALIGHTGVLAATLREVQQVYLSWQGTYAAIFLFSLQPGIFGSYSVTTWLLVFSLLFGILFFSVRVWALVKELNRRGENLRCGSIVAVLTFLLMIEGMPSIPEGLYWYNGAVYYTFFFSLSLVLLGLLAGVFSGRTKLPGKIAAFMLGIVISGGNYTTALVTLELVFLAVVCSIWEGKRKPTSNAQVKFCGEKRRTAVLLLLFAVEGACFVVSMAAPGNQQRADAVGGFSAIAAIEEAFRQAVVLIRQYTGLQQILFALCLILIFLLMTGSINRMRHPVGVFLLGSLLLFLLFVSGLVPPIYGVGNIGAGRQQNIYYYTYLILLSAECWLVTSCLKNLIREEKWKSVRKRLLLVDSLLLAAAALITAMRFDFSLTTSGQASAALRDGSLETYAAAYDTMSEQLEQTQGSGADVVVDSITSTPVIFEGLQLEDEPDGWVNVAMARYYGLGSIRTSELVK